MTISIKKGEGEDNCSVKKRGPKQKSLRYTMNLMLVKLPMWYSESDVTSKLRGSSHRKK